MNPLKAFYLQQQQDEQAELNATLNPTPAGEEPEAQRKARFAALSVVSNVDFCVLSLKGTKVLYGHGFPWCGCFDPLMLVMCVSSDSQSFNKVAERVLLRLQEKLKGVEEGAVLSVGGQVNLLIQQAMDPKNLSRLFPGWQAWV